MSLFNGDKKIRNVLAELVAAGILDHDNTVINAGNYEVEVRTIPFSFLVIRSEHSSLNPVAVVYIHAVRGGYHSSTFSVEKLLIVLNDLLTVIDNRPKKSFIKHTLDNWFKKVIR